MSLTIPKQSLHGLVLSGSSMAQIGSAFHQNLLDAQMAAVQTPLSVHHSATSSFQNRDLYAQRRLEIWQRDQAALREREVVQLAASVSTPARSLGSQLRDWQRDQAALREREVVQIPASVSTTARSPLSELRERQPLSGLPAYTRLASAIGVQPLSGPPPAPASKMPKAPPVPKAPPELQHSPGKDPLQEILNRKSIFDPTFMDDVSKEAGRKHRQMVAVLALGVSVPISRLTVDSGAACDYLKKMEEEIPSSSSLKRYFVWLGKNTACSVHKISDFAGSLLEEAVEGLVGPD